MNHEKTRLYFVDSLRALLITLGIMVHLSATYGGFGGWHYYDGEPDQVSNILLTTQNAISQSFFMGCLFLISGYFTGGSYDRKGPKRFLKDRLLRLSIPLLVSLALAMRDVQMFHLLKLAFAAVIAVPLSFALGNVIRKLPLTRRIL